MEGDRSDTIEIRVLGPIEILRDGSRVPLNARRQQHLCALLVLAAGRPVSAARLIDELWAGEPPDGASVTLRSYISRIRSLLGDGAQVRSVSSGYAMDLAPEAIDAMRFQRLVREGDAAAADHDPRRARDRFANAMELWRGDPFDGFGDRGSLQIEADRLAELRLHAIEGRVEADLALGRTTELLDELEHLVGSHPFHEGFWRQLMLALYRSERQADALAAYRRVRSILDEELGLEPGEALRELELAILRHEVPPATPPVHRLDLPAPLTTFIGREEEVNEVFQKLGERRLVTLTGVGGVGKTRLAIEVVARLGGESRDGVVFIDLAPLADPSQVAAHVAAALGVREVAGTPLADLVASHVRELSIVLVFDNCEHLREPVATLIARLLANSPRLRVIATSRETLGVTGEVTYVVPPLGLPDDDDPATIRASEAVKLFLDRARAARESLAIDDDTIATIGRICHDLDGIPLGIELAAARTKVLSPGEIATRLRDRFRFLVTWRKLTTARHRTLRETLDWSYDLLDHDAQRLFCELSVFSGGFTLEAVEHVGTDPASIHGLELLERLVDASLVSSWDRGPEARFRMLETIRQYGAARLEEEGATDDLRRRHAAYFLSLVEARHREAEADGRLTPLVENAPEDSNIRAALQLVHHMGDPEVELRFCAALWRYWWMQGQLSDGRAWIERALARAAPIATEHRAEALRGASMLALRQGDVEAAVAHAEGAHTVSRALGEVSLARAEVGLANAVGSAGNADRAAGLYASATAVFRRVGLHWELAIALLNTADNAFARGDTALAEQAATESLAICRSTGDDAGIAVNLANLAFVAIERDDAVRAEGLLHEALERATTIGVGEWVAIMLDGLGAVAAARGSDEHAARLLGAAAKLRDEIGAALDSIERLVHDRTMERLGERLGAEGLASNLEAGRAMSTAAAVALALDQSPAAEVSSDEARLLG